MSRLHYKRALVICWVTTACLLLSGIAWDKVVDHRMYRNVPRTVILDYPYPWPANAMVLTGFLGLLAVGLAHGFVVLRGKRRPPE